MTVAVEASGLGTSGRNFLRRHASNRVMGIWASSVVGLCALGLVFPLTGLAQGVQAAELSRVEVDHMVRGYFYAGGRTEGIGGFGPSDNLPQPAPHLRGSTGLELRVDTHPEALGSHAGFVVTLSNDSVHEVGLDAEDSRLRIVREARDGNGDWKPIEYLPRSFCGNSYHRVFLPARHQWRFVAPRYSGDFATRMRFRLDADGGPVYSNEFEGQIGLEQFGPKRQGHAPAGLMDPYVE